ncbi:nitroreductase family protein [Bradyrhizobium sp.]|jgi:nitroreductase|uniref:nitroreductase family protein n=1 Tax=Bradyrhizobium sp. TaxID=376 RepID=UPI003C244B59
MSSRIAITDDPIDPALASRWSPRAFADRTIEEQTIASLFEAARWAPSANNLQPWAFIHASRGTEGFDRLRGCLKESNALWAGKAAILALAIVRPTKPDGSVNPHARYDLGQAVAHLTFQAIALGLHVHQMAGFDPERARTRMNIPHDHEAVAAIAIGYLGEASDLPASLQEKERAARTRRPAKSFVFRGQWPDHDQ